MHQILNFFDQFGHELQYLFKKMTQVIKLPRNDLRFNLVEMHSQLVLL